MRTKIDSPRFCLIFAFALPMIGCSKVIEIKSPYDRQPTLYPRDLVVELGTEAIRSSYSANIDGKAITGQFSGSLVLTARPPAYCETPMPETSVLEVSVSRQGGGGQSDSATFTNPSLQLSKFGFLSYVAPSTAPPCPTGSVCASVRPVTQIVSRAAPATVCFKVSLWPTTFASQATLIPVIVTPSLPAGATGPVPVALTPVGGAASAPGAPATARLNTANATTTGACFAVSNLLTTPIAAPVMVHLSPVAKCYRTGEYEVFLQ